MRSFLVVSIIALAAPAWAVNGFVNSNASVCEVPNGDGSITAHSCANAGVSCCSGSCGSEPWPCTVNGVAGNQTNGGVAVKYSELADCLGGEPNCCQSITSGAVGTWISLESPDGNSTEVGCAVNIEVPLRRYWIDVPVDPLGQSELRVHTDPNGTTTVTFFDANGQDLGSGDGNPGGVSAGNIELQNQLQQQVAMPDRSNVVSARVSLTAAPSIPPSAWYRQADAISGWLPWTAVTPTPADSQHGAERFDRQALREELRDLHRENIALRADLANLTALVEEIHSGVAGPRGEGCNQAGGLPLLCLTIAALPALLRRRRA